MSNDNPFATEFTYSAPILREPGVSRRDPSPVICVDGTYHIWYSRATNDPSGYFASLCHATSPGSHQWTEQGVAIDTGDNDAWDGNGVFTCTTLVSEGRYWLYYTAVAKPFIQESGDKGGTPTAIGVAWAASPDGPWTKFEGNPVLRPSEDHEASDSFRVDDACMIVREGKYWMYYKGRGWDKTSGQTRMHLAIADSPTGPFVKHEGNPVFDNGHEVCVWPHGTGVAAWISPTGPQGLTAQYSQDGIRFEKQADVQPPRAPGPFRADNYIDGSGPGITWGLSQDWLEDGWAFLRRFECDLRAR